MILESTLFLLVTLSVPDQPRRMRDSQLAVLVEPIREVVIEILYPDDWILDQSYWWVEAVPTLTGILQTSHPSTYGFGP